MTQSTTPSSAPYVCPVCGNRSFNLYCRHCERYTHDVFVHTPGPWFLEPVDLIVYDGNSASSTAIATVEPRDSEDEREANARLIESAPALLLECQTQLENGRMLQTGQWDGGAEGIQAAIASLETVIARATRTDANLNAS